MPWNTWFLSSYLKDKKILTGYRLALSIKLLRSRKEKKKKKKPYILDYYCKPLPFWQTEEEKAVLGQGAEGLSHQLLHTCISLHGTGASVLMCAPISSSGIFHTSVLESECIFLQHEITTYRIFLLCIQWSMYFCSSIFHHHHLI